MEKIIYGKQSLEKIVSIEPGDSSLELFYENIPGQITSEVKPFKYWLLSNKPFDEEYIKLNGELYYKYGRQFDTKDEWQDHRKRYGWKNFFAPSDAKEQAAIKNGYSTLLGMHPKDVSVLSFDIETTGLDPKAKDAQVLLISTAYRVNDVIQKQLFAYDEYHSQKELIEAFCSFVRECNPSFLIGHNIISFDLFFLYVIAEKNNTSLCLGRDGMPAILDNYERKFRVDGNRDLHYNNFHIYGREILDTYFLAIKSDISRKYNSYGLKAIIEQEGLILPGRTFYDASKIRTNYLDPFEWNKIKLYCEDDSLDSLTLYDKFISPFFYMCQSIAKASLQSVLLSASGSQLNSIMCRAYLQDGHSLPKADEQMQFEGALSAGNPGIYNNFMKLDVSSLYPSVMVEYGIFPRSKDPQEYFPFLVKYFREERLNNKRLAKETGQEYYNHLEQSQKIMINSLYGFMGAPGLLFNDVKGAAEVTRKGRAILSKAMQYVKDKGMVIANIDTDAVLFGYQDGRSISQEERSQIQEGLNKQFPSTISWEDDGYFSKVIILKAKNYILKDEKGKIKYKGSALRSPSLELALREFIEKIVESILNETGNYDSIYREYIREIMDVKDITRWSTRKTLSEKTFESERANESKVCDAIEGTEYVEGDRIRTFFREDETLCLVENFTGDYNKKKLLEKLFKAGKRFETVLPTKELFLNFKLKRNEKLLGEICG